MDIFKQAEQFKDLEKFDLEFEKLTKEQKTSFGRLVKLGDSEELALATVIKEKDIDKSFYEFAYYS
jgi:hypothetical protein